MSHFTVLIIGENWEDQLKPYDENLAGEPHVESCYCDTDGKPNATCDDCAGTGKYTSTYNERSKWDWYAIGGRWAGFFPLKDGATGRPVTIHENPFSPELARQEREHFAPVMDGRHSDQCRKDAIDFETKALAEAKRASDYWDEVHAIVDAHPLITQWEDIDKTNIDAAREMFHNQPVIAALREARLLPFGDGLKEVCEMDRDAYAVKAGRGAVVTHALLAEGAWAEAGSMGWFGVVHDEKEPSDWMTFWWSIVDKAPDDALFTIVDCHI